MELYNPEKMNIIPIFGMAGKKYSENEIFRMEKLCRDLYFDIEKNNDLNLLIDFKYSPQEANMSVNKSTISFGMHFLDSFTQDEIAFCIGHEVAHILHRHAAMYYCLGKVSSFVNDMFYTKLHIGDEPKNIVADSFFMNAIGKRFEHEADILGASLANKAGYHAEISALEKMDKGVKEFINVLDEHPMISERIQYLHMNPYPVYNKEKVTTEYLFLNSISNKCDVETATANDFLQMLFVEQKYICEAHANLVETESFLRNRKFLLEKALKQETVCESLAIACDFGITLHQYDKQLSKASHVTRFGIVHKDVANILEVLRDYQRDTNRHFRKSLRNAVRSIFLQGKEHENDL